MRKRRERVSIQKKEKRMSVVKESFIFLLNFPLLIFSQRLAA